VIYRSFGRNRSLVRRQAPAPNLTCRLALPRVTGGFLPIGGCLAREAPSGTSSRDDPATPVYGHSFTANPVGCAAAKCQGLAVLEARQGCLRQFAARHQPLFCAGRATRGSADRACARTIAAFRSLKVEIRLSHGGWHANPAPLPYGHGVFLRPWGHVGL